MTKAASNPLSILEDGGLEKIDSTWRRVVLPLNRFTQNKSLQLTKLWGVDFSNFFAVLKSGPTPGPYATLADAKAAGAVTVNYGLFMNGIMSFLIVATAVFLFVTVKVLESRRWK